MCLSRSCALLRKISRKQTRGHKRLSAMAFPFLHSSVFIRTSFISSVDFSSYISQRPFSIIHPDHALPLRIPYLPPTQKVADSYFFCVSGKFSPERFLASQQVVCLFSDSVTAVGCSHRATQPEEPSMSGWCIKIGFYVFANHLWSSLLCLCVSFCIKHFCLHFEHNVFQWVKGRLKMIWAVLPLIDLSGWSSGEVSVTVDWQLNKRFVSLPVHPDTSRPEY